MAIPVRSASADTLRNNSLTVWPGMTIFWIGDLGHQGSTSGHNPDDYPNVRAELQDSDLVPEVRALDFMIGPKFTVQDAWNLVNALIKGVDKQRLYYVIYRSTIWRRATGFQPQAYNGSDNHNGHVHTSGYMDDDANGADWRSVLALGEDDMALRDDPDGLAMIYRMDAIRRLVDPITYPKVGGGVVSEPNPMAQKLAELNKTLVEIKALLAAIPPGGLSEEQVRAVVRTELDKTRLIG